MAKLNHINLAAPDVSELSRFFQEGFGMRVVGGRLEGRIVVLRGDDDFALMLIEDKDATVIGYPKSFHVGFLLDSKDEVLAQHTRLVEAGFDAPVPRLLDRWGEKAFGFYSYAPGGVMVEVTAPAEGV